MNKKSWLSLTKGEPAEMIPRSLSLDILRSALEKPTLQGNWDEMDAFPDWKL